jgi:glycosyltransferase involved in cell wall biosynthesis
MSSLIRQTQAETAFDIIHVEHLRGSELSCGVRNAPIVFDSVDSISLLFERVCHSGPTWRSRLLARLDLARTRRYEGQLLDRYSRVLVTSPRDRDALAELSSNRTIDGRLAILPNGVDLDYFSPLDIRRDPATVIFTGKMSYHANIAAALDLATTVMPIVWTKLPHARLVIAGKDPSAELLALKADPRITVTGTVPDLRPYLAQATVAVSPMRYGVGIQNKVLEAMAMATPVVSTPQAVTALQIQAGQDVVVATTPPEMAKAVIDLLLDDTRSQQLGQRGRYYVETHHDWKVAAANLESLYRKVLTEQQGT